MATTFRISRTSPGTPPALLLEPSPVHLETWTSRPLVHRCGSCFLISRFNQQWNWAMQLASTDTVLPSTDSTHMQHSQDSHELKYRHPRPLPPFRLVRIEAHYCEHVPPIPSRLTNTCTSMDPSSSSTAYPSVHLILLCLGPEPFYPSHWPPTCWLAASH